MTDRKYAVAYAGELIEGVSAQGVREQLTRLWSALSASQLDALLGTRSATLKLFADRETADRFVGFMRQAGMVCWLRLLRPGEESIPILADVAWSPDSQNPLPVALPAPSVTQASSRRGAFSPKVAAMAVVIVACAAVALWYAGTSGSSRRTARHAAAVQSLAAPASAAPTIEAETAADAAPAPIATAQSQSRTLLVPEPTLVSARAMPAPKAAPLAGAEAAKLEGTPMPAVQSVSNPAPPVAQTLAMASPVTTPPAIARPAEVVTQPSYDRGRVVQPRYPVQAYRNREQGEVLLNVLVGADGKARKVSVDRTSGSALLDRAALDAVKSWQFTPGTRNGIAREAARQVAVGFKLDE